MKVLIVLVLTALSVQAQTTRSKQSDELKQLHAEFVKATEEYKASLARMLVFQEERVMRAEVKLEQSRKLSAQGLLSTFDVEQVERALATARADVVETKKQIANADADVVAPFQEAKLAQELKRAKAARRRSRAKPCLNWDIVISQRQTAKTFTFTYKIVCR